MGQRVKNIFVLHYTAFLAFVFIHTFCIAIIRTFIVTIYHEVSIGRYPVHGESKGSINNECPKSWALHAKKQALCPRPFFPQTEEQRNGKRGWPRETRY